MFRPESQGSKEVHSVASCFLPIRRSLWPFLWLDLLWKVNPVGFSSASYPCFPLFIIIKCLTESIKSEMVLAGNGVPLEKDRNHNKHRGVINQYIGGSRHRFHRTKILHDLPTSFIIDGGGKENLESVSGSFY